MAEQKVIGEDMVFNLTPKNVDMIKKIGAVAEMVLFQPGDRITYKSPSGEVIISVKFDMKIPGCFTILNMPTFIRIISMGGMKAGKLVFKKGTPLLHSVINDPKKKNVSIFDGYEPRTVMIRSEDNTRELEYTLARANHLPKPPISQQIYDWITQQTFKVSFEITPIQSKTITDMAATLRHETITILIVKGKISIVSERKEDADNRYVTEVGSCDVDSYSGRLNIKSATLPLTSAGKGSIRVELMDNVSKWSFDDPDIMYIMPHIPNSK